MDIFGLIKMLGGLALFLYGMSILGNGLEHLSGGRLERTLEKLTNSVWKGVLLGAMVTAAIQSSSATTVIVVGLVNARVLKLRNAIGVIMGANIGTTITAHILRLSEVDSNNPILLFLKPSTLAPLVCIIGALLYMTAKRSKKKDIGTILLGFGILFNGMFAMEAAVSPLKDVPWFVDLFKTFSNPILGVLVGTFVTAVIQSSSASVGILQALSTTGFITYSMAFPIIMGQNIGTCITPVLASIGASKNAKRTACVHVTFNILGTIVFLIAFYSYQYTIGFSFWDMPIDKGGIANFHTVFNTITTLLFIPFTGLLDKIACLVVKDQENEKDRDTTAIALDERLLVSPGLALKHVREAVIQMATIARQNVINSVALLDHYDPKMVERINENEDTVDRMENRVESYLLALSERELSDSESHSISELLHTCGEFERIADHAQNICECATKLYDTKTSFSKKAAEEMHLMVEAVQEAIELGIRAFRDADIQAAEDMEPLEEVIDEIEQILREKHILRLRKGKCTVDAAFPFVEALSNLERVADLCSNVAESVITYDGAQRSIDRHIYKKAKVQSENYQEKYIGYTMKYMKRFKKESKGEKQA